MSLSVHEVRLLEIKARFYDHHPSTLRLGEYAGMWYLTKCQRPLDEESVNTYFFLYKLAARIHLGVYK